MSSAGDRLRVVIVGGGSAGLMCALGLSERADVTVVEAGIDPGSPPPARFLHQHLYPDCDWDYRDADSGRHLVRGKVLGGSSTVNASAAVRGQPSCFESWGEGWRWPDVSSALCAIETDAQFGERPWHGDRGPVTVTRLPGGELDAAFGAAASVLGHEVCADHNEPGSMGAGPWPTNRVAGGRWSTLAAVAPALRSRVTIEAGTHVERVVLAGTRAVGVEVRGPAGLARIDADIVVVAAGTYGTPELLWRSGVVHPLVGHGLQDHPWVMMDVTADAGAIAQRPVSGALLRGVLRGDRDLEFQAFGFSAALYQPEVDPSTYRMSVAIMAPRSIGRMRPGRERSAIHLGHLADAADLDDMAAAVTHAADLLDVMVAERRVVLPERPWWRAPDGRAQLRARVESYNHPVGTCGIGRVVDAGLRVEGYEGLRIADASVMPSIPKANTNLSTMMIGWRAAALISHDERLLGPAHAST